MLIALYQGKKHRVGLGDGQLGVGPVCIGLHRLAC